MLVSKNSWTVFSFSYPEYCVEVLSEVLERSFSGKLGQLSHPFSKNYSISELYMCFACERVCVARTFLTCSKVFTSPQPLQALVPFPENSNGAAAYSVTCFKLVMGAGRSTVVTSRRLGKCRHSISGRVRCRDPARNATSRRVRDFSVIVCD